jgi:hypothetical protein
MKTRPLEKALISGLDIILTVICLVLTITSTQAG